MKLSVWTVDKRELEKRASEEGATVECIVSDAVAKYLNIDKIQGRNPYKPL